jgi:hypothetical protein
MSPSSRIQPSPRIQRVRKRDGREVPYDRRKIESAVARAEAAAGNPLPGFPGEITDVVERLLERRFPDPALAIPGIEDVQDLVERALVEMGAAAVAKTFILYREKRAQVRAALLVRDDGREETRSFAHAPRVQARDKVEAWSKGKIVAALMSEADLPRDSAEAVASRVEARVFAGGSRSISTSLVRELVDNELVELGLEGALRRQRPIGIPRHDLRRALFDRAGLRRAVFDRAGQRRAPVEGEGGRVEDRVGGEILSRFAMEDLLPPYVGDLVRGGDLEFEDLSLPHLPLVLAVPFETLAATPPGPAAAAAILPEIGRLARTVSRTLVVEGAEPLLAALAGGDAFAVFLAGVAAAARSSGRDVEFVLREPRLPFLDALLETLAVLEREGARDALPRIVVDASAARSNLARGGRAIADAARLARFGLLVPSWSGEGEAYAGAGLARSALERGARSLGAVAVLNLPRLARQAGAWREEALFESVAGLLDAALDGLSALDDFRRECSDPSVPRTHPSSGLALVGLREALATLGDGELREEHAAKLVAFLSEAVERGGRRRGVPLSIAPSFGERVAERFARIDAGQFRPRQPWLFADPAPGDALPPRAYGAGFELGDRRALLAAIGSVPSGSLRPPSAIEVLAGATPADASAADARLLEVFDLLARARGRTRGGAHALFALPPVFGSAQTSSGSLASGAPASEDLFASAPSSRNDP